MLNFSPEKLFLVGIIALVVLGPHRLPQAARSFGRFLAQLRHMSSSFQDEVRGALHDPMDAVNSVIGDFRPPGHPPVGPRRHHHHADPTVIFVTGIARVIHPLLQRDTPVQRDGHSNGQDAPSLPVAPDDPSLN